MSREKKITSASNAYFDIIADVDANSADTDAKIRFFTDGFVGAGTQQGNIGYDQGVNCMVLGAGSNSHIYIEPAGDVGVGISNPITPLHVYGANDTDASPHLGIVYLEPNADGADATLTLKSTRASDRVWGVSAGHGTTNTPIFRIIDETAATDRLDIDLSGNVGIGIITPVSRLDVRADDIVDGDLSYQIHISNNTDTGTASSGISFSNNYNGANTPAGMGGIEVQKDNATAGNVDSHLSLFTRANTDGVYGPKERLRIGPAGNVGIGIATPDGRLHVHTATAGTVTPDSDADDLTVENSGNCGISVLSPNTNFGSIRFGDPENNDIGRIVYSHGTNTLYLYANDYQLINLSDTGTEWLINFGDDDVNRDVKLLFEGSVNDGTLYWMNDEDYFLFDNNVVVNGTVRTSTVDDNNLDIIADSDANSADTDSKIRFYTDGVPGVGTQQGNVGYDQGDDCFVMGYGSNKHVYIDSSGQLGIKVAAPNEDLEVAGKIRTNTGFNINGSDGWTGWFDDGVNFRVTVTNGIITAVANTTAGGHNP